MITARSWPRAGGSVPPGCRSGAASRGTAHLVLAVAVGTAVTAFTGSLVAPLLRPAPVGAAGTFAAHGTRVDCADVVDRTVTLALAVAVAYLVPAPLRGAGRRPCCAASAADPAADVELLAEIEDTMVRHTRRLAASRPGSDDAVADRTGPRSTLPDIRRVSAEPDGIDRDGRTGATP